MNNIFPIINGQIIPRAFYRVFDKKEYAQSFMSGQIHTQPIDYYSNLTVSLARRDKCEGIFEDLIYICKTPEKYHYSKLGNSFEILSQNLLEDFRITDAILSIQGYAHVNILCTTYIDLSKKEWSLQILQHSLKFGNYFVFFNYNFLLANLSKKYRTITHPVIYGNHLSYSPFVKKKRYELEQECRFLFPDICESNKLLYIPPLPAILINVEELNK